MISNFSSGIPYHTQRNNQVVPYASCNTTSMIMALKQAGRDLPPCYDKQPEDELSRFLRTQEAFQKQKELAGWSVGAYAPQEVHAVLEWGVNQWMGAEVDSFMTSARTADLLVELDSGGGAVLSGRFPMPSGDLGHIVSLAGWISNEHGEIEQWIIDDPYGNWHTGYTDYRGNDVLLSTNEFKRIFDRSGDGEYWAHLIRAHEG